MRRLLFLLFLPCFSCVSVAQTVDVSILIDRSGSGDCTVAGVDPVNGVDARLTASLDSATAQVDVLTLETCQGGSFGAPQTLDGGYPVGLNIGEGGADVVELSVDSAALGSGSAQFTFTALADDGSSIDQAGGGFAGITVPVPLAPWAFLVLALALLGVALWALRRHRGPTALLLGLLAVTAWAAHFMLDGEISDWTGVTPISDPAGDATAGGNRTDILAVFSAEEDGRLWFRVDLADIENAAPSAANDAFSTDEDTVLSGENVLADNGSGADSDPDGDTLTVTGFDATSAEGAAVTIAANGDLDYDPTGVAAFQALAVGELQDDTFTYTIEDPDGSSDTATVTVTVDGVNDAPTASDDAFATDKNTPITTTSVLANDTDPDTSDTLSVDSIDTTGTQGLVTDNGDGTFDYDPNGQFDGLGDGDSDTDTFVYTVTDSNGGTDTAAVTITINGANTAPVATDDAFATDEDSVLTTGDVLANDTDAEGDTLSVDSVDTTGTVGSVTDNGDGTFDYDPNGQFETLANGDSDTDSFTYIVSDGNGGTDTATVTITINGVNDAPTANDDAFATDEEVELAVAAPGVLGNDDDVDTGDTLTAVLDTDVSNGTLTFNADGSFNYTPDTDFNGSDSFTYHATDGTADSPTATATITVDSVNDSPNAVDDLYMTGEDAVLSEPPPGVLTNDTDPDMDPLTVTTADTTSAQGATVTVNADGSFSYDPTGVAAIQALDDGEMLDDTFGYTMDDGSANPDTATVTVTVNGANDAPVAADDGYATDEDVTLNVPAAGVLGNDTDVDVETLTTVLSSGPSNAVAFLLNGDGSFSYTPAPNFNGSDSFTYRASDGTATSNLATVTITVNPVNDPPVADDEVVSAACNIEQVVEANAGETAEATAPVFRTVTDNVLIGDSDPVEGTAIQIIQASGAPGGTSDGTAPFEITTNQGGDLTLHADGSFVYTPEGGDRGVFDSFTYTIEDADGGTDTATVTLNVASTCVWFVDNSVSTSDDVGTGSSSDPFTSLVDELGPDALPDDAEDASQPGDVIYVFEGDSQSGDPYDGNFAAEANERILGQGVDLVVDFGSGPETLFTGNPANRPLVVGVSAGVAVSVIDVTGVEVAGLELAGGDHAVSVFGITGAFDLDLHDNEMSGSSNESIVVNQSGVFDSTLAITANAVTAATGESLNVEVGAGTLALAIDGNALTSMANGIDLDGTGAFLYVTSFCGNTLSGDIGGIGVAARGVIFDANPSDADFTGDEVGCTGIPTSIGSALNPVAFAMLLEDVAGDLAFGTLDLYSDGVGQVGLEVTGTGPLDAAAGTGFEITSSGGTVDSANGPALTLFDSTLGLTLTGVTSNDSPSHGVLLNAVTGTLSVTDGTTVSSSAGLGIDATASPGVGVDFGATSLSGSDGGIRLASSPGADFTVASLDVTTTGTALDVNDAGTVNIGGVANTLETTAGAAIRAQLTSMGAGGWTFDNVTSDNSPSVGILLNAMTGGNFLVTGATDINEPMSTGIEVSTGGARTYDFGSTDISGAGSVVPLSGGRGVNAIFGNSMSSLVFDSLNITTDNGAGLVTNGVGLLAIAGASNSIVANNGNALWLESTTVDELPGGPVTGITFATLSSANSPLDGISLRSVTGSVTGNAGSITGALDVAVHIGSGANNSGGSGNVTYAGSITNTADHSVLVQERTGGAVTLSGNINDTGTGILVQNNNNGVANTITFSGSSKVLNTGTNTAVLLDNNDDAAVSFTNGGLDIDTTSGTDFIATGGGTIIVTGSGNTVNTTTGAGVNITNTTIGAAGVILRSVTSTTASANTVIALTNTGTGPFEVTGTGSAGSGGTIGNKTADAVTLDNTDGSVTLRGMIIEDIGDMSVVDSEHDAIHGQNVDGGLALDNMTIRRISDMAVHGGTANGDADTVWNGLTINNSTIEDANRYHVAGDGVGDTSDEGGVRIRGLRGAATITNNTFQETGEHLDLFATAGTLNLTATGNNFFETYKEFDSGTIASVGKICLDLTVQGAANATVDVSGGNTFRNCRIASVRVGNDSAATGTVTSTVANNSFLVTDHSSGNGGDFDFPMGGVKYSTRGATTAVFDGRITGNSFTDVTNADGGVGNVTLDMDQGVIQVLVDGNTFHAPGNAAWFVRADGTSSFELEFDTNTYQQDAFPCTVDPSCGGGYDGPGLFNRVQVQNGGVIDFTLNNEALAEHDVGFDPGNTVEVQVLNVGGGGTACASFTGNASPHGYALEESAGTLNLARGVSPLTLPATCSGGAPANCVTVLDDNSNIGGGGNPAADPPTVSVFGTIDIVSSACSFPSGIIF